MRSADAARSKQQARRHHQNNQITMSLPACPDIQRLIRYVAILEALGRNDGRGARQLVGTVHYDIGIYDEGDAASLQDGALVGLLHLAQQRSADCAHFARALLRTLAQAVDEFLEQRT